jgi:hypothetical protein
MPRFITPTLLRTLLLGSLGLAEQACSTNESLNSNGGQALSDGGPSSGGAHSTGSGGQTIATGGHVSGSGGQANGGTAAGDGGYAGAGGSRDDAGTGGSTNDAGWTGDDAGLVSAKGCTNPVPLIPRTDTGIYTCSEGYWHRTVARQCASHLPRNLEITPPLGVVLVADDCARDSDCTARNTSCVLLDGTEYSCGNAPKQYRRICQQGCRVDADCGAASVCVCGADIGICVAVNDHAGCHSDADCSAGLCLSNASLGPFGPGSFACQLASDQCDSRADCVGGYCSMSPTGRTCMPAVACGRPFIVEHAPRLAAVVGSDAWLGAPEVAGIELPSDPEVARRLAEHWTHIGLMEHASVAAFARFTLQLLGLGAPLGLVQSSTEAQADETRHAALAFQMASLYGAVPVGPAPLDLRGALDDLSLADVLRTTIAEGCVGETRAALEAAEAARVATVPGVKRALERIAADESGHAALAWRVVKWILGEHPELASVAEAEFARVASPAPVVLCGPGRAPLLAHGLLDTGTLGRIHASAAREVIAPCAQALLNARAA